MCFAERKIPAAVVGVLSIITLLLSLAMIFLAIRFNNDGVSTDFGEMSDYANFAFIALLAAAVLALVFSICGIVLCKLKNRCVTLCFGMTVLPIAISIVVFGSILTGISHTEVEDLKSFCS